MSVEVSRIKRFFEAKNLHVSDYWLECCMDWFKSNHSSYDENTMCDTIYDQWLQTDLRDVEVRSLPPNLSTQKKLILDGSYAVQIMYVKDVSRSRLSQVNKIRDLYKLTREIVEFESVPQGKRMLYLYLTDGVQFVTGFEYKPLPKIADTITPGSKLLLKGPLHVRNGEILLEDKNIQILGGQVDDLSICNATENVLARELNLPLNPNPGEFNRSNQTNLGVNTQQCHTIVSNQSQVNINEVIDLDGIEDEFMMDLSTDFNQQRATPLNENNQQSNNRQQNNQQPTNQLPNNQLNEIYDITEDDLLLEEEMFADFHRADTINLPIKVSENPYIYIKQLTDNKSKVANKTFRVKGQFMQVIQKIAVSSVKGWSMKFEITDGTGVLNVDIASDIIENLTGISPEQIIGLKEKIQNKDVRAADRLKEALGNCKQKFLEMNCYIDLRFTADSEPIVVNLEPVLEDDMQLINVRINLQ